MEGYIGKDVKEESYLVITSDIDLTNAYPSSNLDHPSTLFKSKNNTTIGKFGVYNATNGEIYYYFHIPASIYHNNPDAGIRLVLKSDGSAFVNCSV